jgi:hypothetical protein
MEPTNPKIICEIATSLTSEEVARLFRSYKFKCHYVSPPVVGASAKLHVIPEGAGQQQIHMVYVCVQFKFHLIAEAAKVENKWLTPTALACEALKHLQLQTGHSSATQHYFHLVSCWTAHDEVALRQTHINIHTPGFTPGSAANINGSVTADSQVFNLAPIHDYYGPSVATYFAYLKYYQHCLRLPTLCGICLGVQEFVCGSRQLLLLPIFGVGLAIWSTIFVRLWKRKHGQLLLEWSLLDDISGGGALSADMFGRSEAGTDGKTMVSVSLLRYYVSLFVIVLAISDLVGCFCN